MRHGGDISQARAAFGGAPGDWLDLSTGIAPAPYPMPAVNSAAWQQLPQQANLDALLAAARHAYRVPDATAIVAAPGTQILIQLLPLLQPTAKTVRILGPTYSEHAICWRRYVNDVREVSSWSDLVGGDVIVLTNPNNPDGGIVSPDKILSLAGKRKQPCQLIIVDEAFADTHPEISVIAHAGSVGVLVLRSFGKFYGLAGLRLGFAIGQPNIINALTTLLGPWAVAGPACDIGAAALRDDDWAARARQDYRKQAEKLDALLRSRGFEIIGGTALFRLARHHDAQSVHQGLAAHGILTRKFMDRPMWLRFGLPGHSDNFERLSDALGELATNTTIERC